MGQLYGSSHTAVCVCVQVSEVKSYEEEARIAFATHLDIEGKTEEAVASLESINNISSNWHLAQVGVWGL